jgi:hypothetical protein
MTQGPTIPSSTPDVRLLNDLKRARTLPRPCPETQHARGKERGTREKRAGNKERWRLLEEILVRAVTPRLGSCASKILPEHMTPEVRSQVLIRRSSDAIGSLGKAASLQLRAGWGWGHVRWSFDASMRHGNGWVFLSLRLYAPRSLDASCAEEAWAHVSGHYTALVCGRMRDGPRFDPRRDGRDDEMSDELEA